MRPRHFSRGRLLADRIPQLGPYSFNEDATFQPRKISISMEHHPHEEPASMRPRHFSRGRSRQSVGRWGHGCSAASMRPRHFSRGRSALLLEIGPGETSFNEAAAFQPRKIMRADELMKMGGDASMRPRHFSRG